MSDERQICQVGHAQDRKKTLWRHCLTSYIVGSFNAKIGVDWKRVVNMQCSSSLSSQRRVWAPRP